MVRQMNIIIIVIFIVVIIIFIWGDIFKKTHFGVFLKSYLKQWP